MKKTPIIYQVLSFSNEEIKMLVRLCARVMHADKKDRFEEWRVIKLIPDLLATVHDKADIEKKKEWRTKFKWAISTIIDEQSWQTADTTGASDAFTDPGKQRICLLVLLKVTTADKHIDTREVACIVRELAEPWGYSVSQLIKLVKDEKDEMLIPGTLVKILEEYK